MESSSTQGSIGVGQSGNLNSDFKLVKQLEAQHQSSIKNLTPNASKVAEMGADFSIGSDFGVSKVNTGEAAQFNFSVAAGIGGLVDEVF